MISKSGGVTICHRTYDSCIQHFAGFLEVIECLSDVHADAILWILPSSEGQIGVSCTSVIGYAARRTPKPTTGYKNNTKPTQVKGCEN